MVEVPVGFKWFVPGLIDGSFGFGGEESAGASFLRRDGRAWTTDKDGLLLACSPRRSSPPPAAPLASTTPTWSRSTVSRRTPGSTPPPTASRRPSWPRSPPRTSSATELAGEQITAKLTEAPGNGAKIGGLKVTTDSAWFAARPSGTEDVYKIYAESFQGPEHLAQVQAEARDVVSAALGG